MKFKFTLLLLLVTVVLVLVGCGEDDTDEEPQPDSGTDESAIESEEDAAVEGSMTMIDEEEEDEQQETETTSADEPVENQASNEPEDETDLSQYTAQEIEYARVWLQLGDNQEIDELNVRHIPAGEALNPEDETSLEYPEDVIQLAGSRLIDGSITYSGNGDGTINVYNVPLRWDGQYPAGEEFYREIIDSTQLVAIDPGENESVIELIRILNH